MSLLFKYPLQYGLLHKFNSTSGYMYLDDILAVFNPKLEHYDQNIYPTELKLTKSNINSNHTPFFDVDLTL